MRVVTQTVQIGQLMSMMETFGIKHSARSLADQLDTAERNELSCREFLATLLITEVEGRNARKSKRNYAAAHFLPNARALGEFNPEELESGMSPSQLAQLAELSWHAEVDRKAGFRLKYLKKAQLVIIDEIGYTPINRNQANRFFGFVSDAYERTSMVFTTNNEITQWVELIGDQTLTTAMLDRILHHARCFSLRGESYRLKHPEAFASI